jgi:hypothetical protein
MLAAGLAVTVREGRGRAGVIACDTLARCGRMCLIMGHGPC